jgi:hypothetical protein
MKKTALIIMIKTFYQNYLVLLGCGSILLFMELLT